MSTNEPATPMDDEAAEHLVAAYDEAVEPESKNKAVGMMNNESRISAYERTGGTAGNPEADALLAEIQKRNLDL